jgi:hypothetical protein
VTQSGFSLLLASGWARRSCLFAEPLTVTEPGPCSFADKRENAAEPVPLGLGAGAVALDALALAT